MTPTTRARRKPPRKQLGPDGQIKLIRPAPPGQAFRAAIRRLNRQMADNRARCYRQRDGSYRCTSQVRSAADGSRRRYAVTPDEGRGYRCNCQAGQHDQLCGHVARVWTRVWTAQRRSHARPR